MRLIWATRGRTWGFRFLLTGGITDPLLDYEAAFSTIANSPKAWRRVDDKVALRFPDPLARQDSAGRVIPHEFVVFEPDTNQIRSVEDGIRLIWPQVEEHFAHIWDGPDPAPASR